MQSNSEQREGDFRKKLKNFCGGGDQVRVENFFWEGERSENWREQRVLKMRQSVARMTS
jgi:hypothetical protein